MSRLIILDNEWQSWQLVAWENLLFGGFFISWIVPWFPLNTCYRQWLDHWELWTWKLSCPLWRKQGWINMCWKGLTPPQERQMSSWGNSSKPHPLSSKVARCQNVVTRCLEGGCNQERENWLVPCPKKESDTPKADLQSKGKPGSQGLSVSSTPSVKMPVDTRPLRLLGSCIFLADMVHISLLLPIVQFSLS